MIYDLNGKYKSTYSATDYLFLVKKIANDIHKKINFCVDINDLIQAGSIGLLDSIAKYIPDPSAKFETFASIKIKGAIIDEIRKNDHLTQEDRKAYNSIKKNTKILLNYKNSFSDEEIAKLCNISIADYYRVLQANSIHEFIEIKEDLEIEDKSLNIEKIVQRKEMLTIIQKAIKKLNEKEQLIMQLIYVEEFSLSEIAETLDLSKTRIAQLHSQIIEKIKIDINH